MNPKQTLKEAVETVTQETDAPERLEEMKERAESRRNRDDTLWYEIVLSFSTWGNSRGSVLVKDEKKYAEMKYEKARDMSEEDRIEHFEKTMEECNVRYHERKSGYLSDNLEMIENMGGPSQAYQEFEDAEGKEGKIAFLKEFKGIGDKYARNIGMDLHHPDFRDTIAVDNRIKDVSEELGVEFNSYEEHEEFYRSVANEMGMDAWDLDRLLYRYKEEVKNEVEEG